MLLQCIELEISKTQHLTPPKRFDINPDSDTADKRWMHWLVTFENLIQTLHTKNPDHYYTSSHPEVPKPETIQNNELTRRSKWTPFRWSELIPYD